MGFKTVINLNTAREGSVAEAAAAKAAGIEYINIQVATRAPNMDQVKAFAKLIENPANYPILVHCESANRVGAMWALYRPETEP